MTGLGNSIFFKLIQVWIDPISCCNHIALDFLKGGSLSSTLEATDIFSQEPFRLIPFEDIDSIGIEGAKLSIKPLLLSHNGKIITRETESKSINFP